MLEFIVHESLNIQKLILGKVRGLSLVAIGAGFGFGNPRDALANFTKWREFLDLQLFTKSSFGDIQGKFPIAWVVQIFASSLTTLSSRDSILVSLDFNSFCNVLT